MFLEAHENPEKFRFYDGKVEVPFVGEKNIKEFEENSISDHQMGVYRVLGCHTETLGLWSGSSLYLGNNAAWRVRIKEKSVSA